MGGPRARVSGDPALFPAVRSAARTERRWYFDGGTRLNTPIKPALALGAARAIVIALNSLRPTVETNGTAARTRSTARRS